MEIFNAEQARKFKEEKTRRKYRDMIDAIMKDIYDNIEFNVVKYKIKESEEVEIGNKTFIGCYYLNFFEYYAEYFFKNLGYRVITSTSMNGYDIFEIHW